MQKENHIQISGIELGISIDTTECSGLNWSKIDDLFTAGANSTAKTPVSNWLEFEPFLSAGDTEFSADLGDDSKPTNDRPERKVSPEAAPPPGNTKQPHERTEQPAPSEKQTKLPTIMIENGSKESQSDITKNGNAEIDFSLLSDEKQVEINTIIVLHGLIAKTLGEKGLFKSDLERQEFIERLKKESFKIKDTADDKTIFEKLPEIGEATKEGYARLVHHLTREGGSIDRRLDVLEEFSLKAPPNSGLHIVGRDLEILKSNAQLRQEIKQGKASIGVDTNDLAIESLKTNLEKVSTVLSWNSDIDLKIHKEIVDRRTEVLKGVLEKGIAEGSFPDSWRRPDTMDKESWCAAFELAKDTYTRFARTVEAINHVKNADNGFKTDALERFPKAPDGQKGISIETLPDGSTKVHFGYFMQSDLRSFSAANAPKLAELNTWCEQYKQEGQKALAELVRAGSQGKDGVKLVPHDAIGYGICEIDQGFVNPETKEWTQKIRPNDDKNWQQFNLLTYEMSITNKLDAFGKPSTILITPKCSFHYVPPVLGYCNLIKVPLHIEEGKALEYKPKQFVAVQTSPTSCEMMHADEVANWQALRQLRDAAETATVIVMDVAMVASGGMALIGTKQMLTKGVQALYREGGKMAAKSMTELPKQMVKEMIVRQTGKGLFEIGLGVLGPVTHGAGSREYPVLKLTGHLRSAFFVAQGAGGLLSWLRVPQLAKSALRTMSPRVAGSVENVSNVVRGTEATRKALELTQQHALKSLGESWVSADKTLHHAFSGSETAFIAEFFWDVYDYTEEARRCTDSSAKQKAHETFIEVNLLDRRNVQRLTEKSHASDDLLDFNLRNWKTSLGPLSKESGQSVDKIIDKIKELSKAGTTQAQKDAARTELMDYFRYSGNKIRESRISATEKLIAEKKYNNVADGSGTRAMLITEIENFEPYSEDELTSLAASDSHCDPKVRKTAALAMMYLARDVNGGWSDVVAKRTFESEGFTVVLEAPENSETEKRVEIKKKSLPISQDLPLTEVYDILSNNLHKDTDYRSRILKAAIMVEAGLIAREHLASLLMTQLDGTDGTAGKEEKMRAIAALGRCINKLEIEETARNNEMSEQFQYVAKGMTAGMTARDFKRAIVDLLPSTADSDIKATILFTLDFLNKSPLDAEDCKRFKAVYCGEKPGISNDNYQKLLREDLKSAPSDEGSWERKFVAIERLLRDVDTDDTATVELLHLALKDCIQTCPHPETKLKACELALAPDHELALRILILTRSLEESNLNPEYKNIKQGYIGFALKALGSPGIAEDTTLPLLERAKASFARAKLVSLLTSNIHNSDAATKVQRMFFETKLLSMLDRSSNLFERAAEVRAEAVKGIGTLHLGKRTELNAIEHCVDPKIEKSPLVRLEAIAAIEKMVLNSRDLKAILGPRATDEPDAAVQDRLRRYYSPKGNIHDRTSEKSKQTMMDVIAEHNKSKVDEAEVRDYIERNHPKLLNNKSVFNYFDTSKRFTVFCVALEAGEVGRDLKNTATDYLRFNFDSKPSDYRSLPFSRAWQDHYNLTMPSTFSSGFIDQTKSNAEMLIRYEAVAAVEAMKSYMAQVDDLALTASRGTDKEVALGKGITSNRMSEKDAAIYTLGYLLSHGPQMKDALWKHRKDADLNNADPGYEEFTEKQQKVRQSAVRDGMFLRRLDVTGFKENGLTPPCSEEEAWHRMEAKIATAFKSMAVTADNTALVTLEILRGLESSNVRSDETKVILVDALDKILSRKDLDQEFRTFVIKNVIDTFKKCAEGQIEGKQLKSASMNAMMVFLDKYAIKKGPLDNAGILEPFSDEATNLAVALNARMDERSTSTPSTVKLRANELYERRWESVLTLFDHRPSLWKLRAADKLTFLPSDQRVVEKTVLREMLTTGTNFSNSVDETVDAHVQAIVDATNGDCMGEGDPRRAVLFELTDEKYHDRVRLAAAIALTLGTEDGVGKSVLATLAVNCDAPAIRHDAMRTLERTDSQFKMSQDIPAANRMPLIARLSQIFSRPVQFESKQFDPLDETKLQTASTEFLIALAYRFIDSINDKANAEQRDTAFELRQDLYKLGSALANHGAIQLNAGGPSLPHAETNLKNAMRAFGLNDKTMETLVTNIRSDTLCPFAEPDEEQLKKDSNAFSEVVRRLCDNLTEIKIHSGKQAKDKKQLQVSSTEMSSLILALNKYSMLNANAVNASAAKTLVGARLDDSNAINSKVDTTTALLTLSSLLTEKAYPEGTGQRADSHIQGARAFRKLSESRLLDETPVETADRYHKSMVRCFEKAEADLLAMKKNDPLNTTYQAAAVRTREEFISALAAKYNFVTATLLRGKWKYSMISYGQVHGAMEELWRTHPDKSSIQSRLDMTLKQLIDARLERNANSKTKRLEVVQIEIEELVRLAREKFGLNSKLSYEACTRLIQLSNTAKNPEISEKFFTNGLDSARNSGDKELELFMLKMLRVTYTNNQKEEKARQIQKNIDALKRTPGKE